jgi:hypothetical protein
MPKRRASGTVSAVPAHRIGMRAKLTPARYAAGIDFAAYCWILVNIDLRSMFNHCNDDFYQFCEG